jgi:hypothetical protein
MSMGSAWRRFGATPCRIGPAKGPRPRLVAGIRQIWRRLEFPCILVALTLGNIGVVKIVDALLDALHN